MFEEVTPLILNAVLTKEENTSVPDLALHDVIVVILLLVRDHREESLAQSVLELHHPNVTLLPKNLPASPRRSSGRLLLQRKTRPDMVRSS
jgi:hypothetical protein